MGYIQLTKILSLIATGINHFRAHTEISRINASQPTSLTICKVSNFSCFNCRLLTFFKINFFKKFFQEHYQSVKQFCQSWYGSKLFAKVIVAASKGRANLTENSYETSNLISFLKLRQQNLKCHLLQIKVDCFRGKIGTSIAEICCSLYGPRCEKPCLQCLPTKAQTSLGILEDWSAPLLFWQSTISKLATSGILIF